MRAARGRPSTHARGAVVGSSHGAPPEEPRVTPFQLETEELVVVSIPIELSIEATGAQIAHLTASEWQIVDMVRDGRKNREIAGARGTSTRTVANQIAGLFKKLGVSSRSELVGALYRKTKTP